MNLVTYASPIALQPPTYALGLYQHTLSRELMLQRGEGVLQILCEQHVDLFTLLGKTSGRDVDKLVGTCHTSDGWGVCVCALLGTSI